MTSSGHIKYSVTSGVSLKFFQTSSVRLQFSATSSDLECGRDLCKRYDYNRSQTGCDLVCHIFFVKM